MKTSRTAGIAGLIAALLTAAPAAPAALSFTDIRIWAGEAAGPGVSEAALVVDWGDGSVPQVWGYRWRQGERRTGLDMLASVAGVDRRLAVQGLEAGFVLGFGWDGDGDGVPERSLSFSDNGTPADFTDDLYWNYSVNNEVYYHPDDFTRNSHIVPPATEVVPLGNPYAADNPAPWIQSSTGPADRELAAGSWDGWAYGPYLTVPAEPVPEPSAVVLGLSGLMLALRRRRVPAAAAVLAGSVLSAGAAGPYPPGPGKDGTDAIPANSERIVAWATGVAEVRRGPQQLGEFQTQSHYGDTDAVTGPSDAVDDRPEYPDAVRKVMSLGDGGSVTVTFAAPVTDGPGPDFAVFENGFYAGGRVFAELAFVEVSSDGERFVRFPAVSLTPVDKQMPTFGTIDPTEVWNLAGRHPAGFGTPFDLSELAGVEGLDVSRITHVRIVDVVGSLDPELGNRDSGGRLINDPFPTPFPTGGFDLDAVGVLNQLATGWPAWVEASFPGDAAGSPDVSGPLADPDGDGAVNLLEYACGGDPSSAGDGAGLSVARAAGGGAALTFQRLPDRTDILYEVEASADLSAWTVVARGEGGASVEPVPSAEPAVVVAEEAAGPDGGGPVRVGVSPAGGAGVFLRLRVSLR